MKNITRIRMVLIAICVCFTSAVYAVEPDEVLDDPVLEARARDLSRELRCTVCQGESIDASSASVARDLRLVLREKLVEGLSDQEIKVYLVERYGEYILMRPQFRGAGLVLWLFAPTIFLMGFGFVIFAIRRAGKAHIEEGEE